MLSHWHNQYSIFMHPDLPMIPDRGDRWLMAVLFIHVFFLTFSAFFHLFFFFFFFRRHLVLVVRIFKTEVQIFGPLS